jgi:ADP-ribosyl-[dinitrogen reductase] hydrolase
VNKVEDRIRGAILGLLIGDALGVPYEFHHRDEIPPLDQIEFDPPVGFDRAHRGVPPGTWSDEGAQALCLLSSLLECERFDADDFARRMLLWHRHGYMAVDRIVFDIGITTSRALYAVQGGTPPLSAGLTGQYDNGNGSMMRVLPLALWHRGSDAELVHDAQDQSKITHGHLRSQVCCALYCLWARRVMQEASEPWLDAITTLRQIYADNPEATEELEWSVRPDDISEPTKRSSVMLLLSATIPIPPPVSPVVSQGCGMELDRFRRDGFQDYAAWS